jgi:hypothetical protein
MAEEGQCPLHLKKELGVHINVNAKLISIETIPGIVVRGR